MTTVAHRTTLAFLLALAMAFTAAPVRADDDWNDKKIVWQTTYDEGLALAKKEKKPICLIFTTPWSDRSAQYATVFHDPAIVAKAKRFVMIRLELDPQTAALSTKYAPDGSYVPRTFFLSPDGELWEDVHAPQDEYKYYYRFDPKTTLGGMDAALTKLKQ